MRMGKHSALAVACVAAAMTMPVAASAAVKTYAGGSSPSGKIAIDVKLSKKNKPKKIVALRAADLPGHCDASGDLSLSVNIPKIAIEVNRRGKFHFKATDPTYGNTSSIRGGFGGRRNKEVGGSFVYANHYPADATYPEENCHTDTLLYSVKRGAPDVQPMSRALPGRR